MINKLKEDVLNNVSNSKEKLLDCLFSIQNVALSSINEWDVYREIIVDYENKYGNVIINAIKNIDYTDILPKYISEKKCHVILNYNVDDIFTFIKANASQEIISKAIVKEMEYIVVSEAHKIPVRLEELKNLIQNNKINFHHVSDIETILIKSNHSMEMYEHYLNEIKKVQTINDNKELFSSIKSMNAVKNNTKLKL